MNEEPIKLTKKIIGVSVVNDEKVVDDTKSIIDPIFMNEKIKRPDVVMGSTYKLKPPIVDHAFYITINDIILNEDTDHMKRVPYEIFINSKNMEHYQWITALTRLISAVFRKGGDIEFLYDELAAIHDPNGGYLKKGGVFMPSLVADLAEVIKKHLTIIGVMKATDLDEHQKKLIADKLQQIKNKSETSDSSEENTSFPPDAFKCMKCHQKSVILMDGCKTCLNCADSKCG